MLRLQRATRAVRIATVEGHVRQLASKLEMDLTLRILHQGRTNLAPLPIMCRCGPATCAELAHLEQDSAFCRAITPTCERNH
jgi:hypothetical protein